jgi:hypothetical protein
VSSSSRAAGGGEEEEGGSGRNVEGATREQGCCVKTAGGVDLCADQQGR